jgi:hypothetical protein
MSFIFVQQVSHCDEILVHKTPETEIYEEFPDTEEPHWNTVHQMEWPCSSLLTRIQDALGSNLGRDSDYAKGFHGSPQSLLANSWTLPRLGYDRFLRNPFPIHLPFCSLASGPVVQDIAQLNKTFCETGPLGDRSAIWQAYPQSLQTTQCGIFHAEHETLKTSARRLAMQTSVG